MLPGEELHHITGSAGRKLALVAAVSAWLFLVAYLMVLGRVLNLEIFFVLWLIGVLIALELSVGRFGNPPYLTRMKYVVFIGVAVFGIIVAMKVVEILNR